MEKIIEPKTKKTDARKPDRNSGVVWLIVLSQPALFLIANFSFLLSVSSSPLFATIRAAYTFNTVVFPIIAFSAGLLGILSWWKHCDRRQKGLLYAGIICCAVALCCVSLRIYATHIEPRRLVLREVTIETSKVDVPIRILHVSDIQSDKVGSYEKRAFDRIRALEPDVVLHTGDLLHPIAPATFESELPKIAALFRSVDAPGGILGVFGDVDGWLHGVSAAQMGGLAILESSERSATFGDARISILGLSLAQSRRGEKCREVVETWLEKAGPNDFTILMGHAPDYILDVKDLPIDLCLAGHTHGGQVRLPFYGPIVTFSNVPKKLARGYHAVGQTHLNVSAGMGNEHMAGLPAIRFNCPTEMTLIKLLPIAKAK